MAQVAPGTLQRVTHHGPSPRFRQLSASRPRPQAVAGPRRGNYAGGVASVTAHLAAYVFTALRSVLPCVGGVSLPPESNQGTGVTQSMPIAESTLSAWSHHGPQQASIRAHETIRRALDNHRWPAGMSCDFYLQGSYHNDTNLTGDGDVDVVLELKSVFRHDCSALSQLLLRKRFRSRSHHHEHSPWHGHPGAEGGGA